LHIAVSDVLFNLYYVKKMNFLDDFNLLREHVFEVCSFKCTLPKKELESSEYHACSFKINERSVRYRQAKITPTKIGQFVTIWKRTTGESIQPYDESDHVDLFVVMVKTKSRQGYFVFPKEVLVKQGVFSVNGKGGKRAIRVYPIWDVVDSKLAAKTQKWQLNYFAEIPKNKSIDIQKFKELFSS